MKNHQENIIALHKKYTESDYDESILKNLINAINPVIDIITKNSVEKEDIKQEILIKFIESWSKKEISYGDYYKYLYHKMQNFVKDYKRSKINFKGLSDGEKRRLNFIYHKNEKTEEEIAEYNKLKEKIIYIDNIEYDNIKFNYTIFDECKDILSKEEYELIEMRYKNNLSQQDIGNILNVSQPYINKRLNLILDKIRKEIIGSS